MNQRDTAESERASFGNRLPWQEAAGIAARLADVIHQLHADGQIHGGIRPETVHVKRNGDPSLAGPESDTSDRRDSDRLGVAAPECIGSVGKSVDARTDVYGLGVVLYRMLCGCEPFRSRDAAELQRQVLEDAPQPPRQLVHGIPREVERICLRALSKLPAERFQSAAGMAEALREALDLQNSTALSSIHLSAYKTPEPAAPRFYLIVECALADGVLVPPGPLRDVKSRWRDVAAKCLRHASAEFVDWSDNERLFRVRAAALDEVTEVAVGAGLRIAGAMADLIEEPEIDLPADVAMHVRVQVAEPREFSESDADPLGRDDLQGRRTRFEAIIRRDCIELSRRSLEIVDRWFACEEGGGRDVRRVHGEGLPELSVHVRESATPASLQGRKSQLSILQARWTQACDGLGQIVLLIGEEGMGKSRLVGELKRFSRETADDALVIQWNCLPRYNGAALQPVAHWFHRTLECRAADSAAKRRLRLLEHLEQYHVDSSEVVDALDELIAASAKSDTPTELTQTKQKKRIQSALLSWLKAMSRRVPVLFVVEDLQWVDPVTLELLSQVMEQGPNDRLLTIFTLRPEFETPWGSRAHQTQIALNRLGKRHVAAVLASLWGTSDIADSDLASALAETGGVPLAVEEFARSAGHQQF